MIRRPPRSTLFPTRRSSDLFMLRARIADWQGDACAAAVFALAIVSLHFTASANTDRKSTRLNSSHTVISYAVFCLKKKKSLLYLEYKHLVLTPACMRETARF